MRNKHLVDQLKEKKMRLCERMCNIYEWEHKKKYHSSYIKLLEAIEVLEDEEIDI